MVVATRNRDVVAKKIPASVRENPRATATVNAKVLTPVTAAPTRFAALPRATWFTDRVAVAGLPDCLTGVVVACTAPSAGLVKAGHRGAPAQTARPSRAIRNRGCHARSVRRGGAVRAPP